TLLLIVLLGLTTVLGLAIPAHADPGVIKGIFIEDSKLEATAPLRPLTSIPGRWAEPASCVVGNR
ncbi:MAG TPA: hypothetical protein VN907_01985, partial [Actinomycetes bacterium]|nr:hypothetical protein [Actinomycetes bacterium]